MAISLTKDEKKTLSVLAFLLYRMGYDARSERVYEALAELSEPGSEDFRFAMSGLAASAIEHGDGAKALAAVREAKKGISLSTRETSLLLMEAQALWLQGRKEESVRVRDEFLHLRGLADKETQS